MTESRKINVEGLVALEQPLVKVPLEQIKKSFKASQKYVEKDLNNVSSLAENIAAKTRDNTLPAKDVLKNWDNMLTRLQTLKRKISETKGEEALYSNRSKLRLEHLNELTAIPTAESPQYARWSKVRLDRVLVDYMLRNGYDKTAVKLAGESNIENLVDVELFEQSRRVEEALRKQNCTECLAWCKENSSGLKKIKSTLEFNLRLQEYIELVRSRKLADAIKYLRKYLTPLADVHMKEIQMASGLLAFDLSTSCERYKTLFDADRWNQLIQQFRTENCTLNNLTSQPLLRTCLQAGLAALKTPMCYQPSNCNINCPVCSPDLFGHLAETLPNAHHLNSCLVCRISGSIMNEDNPPMVLPNGYVYSYKALEEIAQRNNGVIHCPRTGTQYHISQTRKAFIS
ncbi:GID complex subunit containing RING finger motif [Chytridiales sp. JEL 0842]|nr:GID complex subunit containing RING finger motif [Chytridiales sp. JEL 0842]